MELELVVSGVLKESPQQGAFGSKLCKQVESSLVFEVAVQFARGILRFAERVNDAAGRYIEFCKSAVPYGTNFRGLKIVVDCAHGATYCPLTSFRSA